MKQPSTTEKNIQYEAYDYGILNIPCGSSKTYLVTFSGKKYKTKVIFSDNPSLIKPRAVFERRTFNTQILVFLKSTFKNE